MKRLLLFALLLASPARADVTLGAVLSLTGPGAGSRNLFGATLWTPSWCWTAPPARR